MSGRDTTAFKIRAYLQSKPGQRGAHIPEQTYDSMLDAVQGITQPIWGRQPTPELMQWLYDQGATTPSAIHAAVGQMSHPHAPNLTLASYQSYAKALQTYRAHR